MRIVSVAAAIPETVVTNEAVEARLGLDPGWIKRRTGILQRPTALPGEATSDLAIRASALALQQSSMDAKDIGLLLLATSTPDHLLPPTAPLVAHQLRLSKAGAVDVAGACAGFLYALVLANAYGQGTGQAVLVVAANILTRRVDPSDAATVSLFSDGAGAVVLVPDSSSCVLGSHLGSDGSSYDAIGIPAGGTREPLTAQALAEGRHFMTMRRGSALFKQAVQAMATAGREALRMARLDVSAVDWWIPHQANVRITREAGNLLGISAERTISVIEKYGNSSAATIPIALAQGVECGRIRKGDTLLLTAAGAGLVSAGVVLRW